MDEHAVILDEEPELYSPRPRKTREDLGTWLIRHHIAKSPIEANYVLLVIIFVCLVLGGFAIFYSDRTPAGPSLQQQVEFAPMNAQPHTTSL
jgi:hypothetical protein